MRFLLDTHTFLWAIAQSIRLSPRLAALMRDPDNTVLVSAISA
jgi:PIN domain nuclease of toxin-antitoxin system